MKKQKVQFFILIAALAVVIGAYFGVEKYVAYVENKAAEEELLSNFNYDLDELVVGEESSETEATESETETGSTEIAE